MRIRIAPGVEKHRWRRRRRRGLAIIDCRVLAVGEMDQHKPAATDVAGARIGHRQRKADRHRGVHRVAAAPKKFNTNTCGARLLRHHHAVARQYRACRRNRRGAIVRRDLGGGGAEGNKCEDKATDEPAHDSLLHLSPRAGSGRSAEASAKAGRVRER